MQGGFFSDSTAKRKVLIFICIALMGRHIFVDSTFGLLAVFLTSRCEVPSFQARSSMWHAGWFFEICSLACLSALYSRNTVRGVSW